MKLIIDIPEEQYNDIVKHLTDNDGNYAYSDFNLREIIRNGIPYNPSGDLISREALRNEVTEKVNFTTVDGHIAYDKMLNLIDNAQAVDLWQMRQEATENALKKAEVLYARPQGEWIIDGHHRRCNKCGEYFCIADSEGNEIPSNFCPNCGVDMMKGGAE